MYIGLNVVGRGSSQADQQHMLDKWKTDFASVSVHGEQGPLGIVTVFQLSKANCGGNNTFCGTAGVFLQNNSISSTHAAICKQHVALFLTVHDSFCLLLSLWVM